MCLSLEDCRFARCNDYILCQMLNVVSLKNENLDINKLPRRIALGVPPKTLSASRGGQLKHERSKNMGILKNKTYTLPTQEGLPFQTDSRNPNMKTVCCICEKTKNGNNWTNTTCDHNEVLSHGYCPECFQKIISKWGLEYI